MTARLDALPYVGMTGETGLGGQTGLSGATGLTGLCSCSLLSPFLVLTLELVRASLTF